MLVRARGRCESCGATEGLQCAHIVSRRYSNTRTDLGNAFALCARCHLYYTNWPIEFARFVTEKIGEDAYDALRRKALSLNHVDWEAEVERLEALRDVSV